ncbi:hypothetical protein V6N13_142565 [Hibiscus sabdariffa]
MLHSTWDWVCTEEVLSGYMFLTRYCPNVGYWNKKDGKAGDQVLPSEGCIKMIIINPSEEKVAAILESHIVEMQGLLKKVKHLDGNLPFE